MRADDPAVLRAAWALLNACMWATEPLYAEEVAIVVREAIMLPDPLWWALPRVRVRELELAGAEAERVVMRLLSPGSEVHAEKFARMLGAALMRLPVSS